MPINDQITISFRIDPHTLAHCLTLLESRNLPPQSLSAIIKHSLVIMLNDNMSDWVTRIPDITALAKFTKQIRAKQHGNELQNLAQSDRKHIYNLTEALQHIDTSQWLELTSIHQKLISHQTTLLELLNSPSSLTAKLTATLILHSNLKISAHLKGKVNVILASMEMKGGDAVEE